MAFVMAGDVDGSGLALTTPSFERVLLKLSGEAFAGAGGFGLGFDRIDGVARQIVEVVDLGVQTAVVVGGGNILRGSAAEAAGMDRARADYMGMLATVMNCLALQDALERRKVVTRVQTAIQMTQTAERDRRPPGRRRGPGMIEDILKEAEGKMRKAIEVAKEEFSGIRTGRANPVLLNRLTVDYYGTPTPLQQLASISAPEARLLVVSPYDRNATAGIEKAIRNSDLGINPANDGQVIRLAFPPLTEERRKEYVKLTKHRAEEARTAIRNVRRHEKDAMERLEKDGEISQDELRRAEQRLQQLTDKYVGEVDSMLQHKERELLET